MLRSPPLRRVASATWGPSTAAEQSSAQQRRRGRERGVRQAKQAFTAAGSKSTAGAKTWDWSVDPALLLSYRWRVMESIDRAEHRCRTWWKAYVCCTTSIWLLFCTTFNIFPFLATNISCFAIILQLLQSCCGQTIESSLTTAVIFFCFLTLFLFIVLSRSFSSYINLYSGDPRWWRTLHSHRKSNDTQGVFILLTAHGYSC